VPIKVRSFNEGIELAKTFGAKTDGTSTGQRILDKLARVCRSEVNGRLDAALEGCRRRQSPCRWGGVWTWIHSLLPEAQLLEAGKRCFAGGDPWVSGRRRRPALANPTLYKHWVNLHRITPGAGRLNFPDHFTLAFCADPQVIGALAAVARQ